MKHDKTGLVAYVCLLILISAGYLGRAGISAALIEQAQAASSFVGVRDHNIRARPNTDDVTTEMRSSMSEIAKKPPTIRTNFSSFYSDYDLAPLPKISAKTVERTHLVSADRKVVRRKRVVRPSLPSEIYPAASPAAAFAFCLFC